jgi:hypothetical protein
MAYNYMPRHAGRELVSSPVALNVHRNFASAGDNLVIAHYRS